MRYAGNSRLAGTGGKTVRPPIRPGTADSFNLVGIFLFDRLDKFRSDGGTQLRPLILLIPTLYHLATLGRRRSVVRKIARMLGGADIVGIILGLQLAEICQDAFLELLEVVRMDTEEIPLVVMLGAISQHLFPGRRFPPEDRRLVETNQGAVSVSTHIQIFDSRVGKILAEAPADTIHIVLHRQFRFQTLLAELFEGIKRRSQGLLVGQLVEIQVHGRQLDATLLDALFQTGNLFRRTAFQVFTDRPGDFARPSELGGIGIVVRGIAIIQGIIDIAKLLCQDFHLRTGITDIRMRMLHHIHLPVASRFHRYVLRKAMRAAHGKVHLCRCVYDGNVKVKTVFAFSQFYLLTLTFQAECSRGRLSRMIYRNTNPLRGSAFAFVHCRIDLRLDSRRIICSVSEPCGSQHGTQKNQTSELHDLFVFDE